MAGNFQTIQLSAPPQASDINRIQSNIANAFNSPSNATVTVVNARNFSVPQGTSLLTIPTTAISGASSGINIALPDATQNSGVSFSFKKTDTSSNTVTFFTTAKNRLGNKQTIENSASYSTSASLASGTIWSDGNNWWVVS